MNGQLMTLVAPVVDLLVGVRFKIKSGRELFPEQLRQEVTSALQKLEDRMQGLPELQAKILSVKQVLVYFADEVILDSGWSQVSLWNETLLEQELFQTRLGGEKFYEMIEEYQGDPEMAELFYTCISLGFQGKYRINPGPLTGIREALYARFSFRLPDDERRLSPGAEQIVPGRNSTLPRMFGIWTLVVVAFVSMGLYVVTSQLIWRNIAGVVDAVCTSLGI